MAINLRCPICKREFSLKEGKSTGCQCGAGFKFKVVVRNQSGKKVTKTVDTLTIARKVEAKFRTSRVEEETFGSRPVPITLADAWLKFLAWAKTHKRSWRADQSRWTYHIEPYLAGKRLSSLTPTDIQALLDRMPEHAPATRKQVLALVKRIINWSIKADLYEGGNPGSRVETPNFDNTVTNPLTREDLQKLLAALDACNNPQFRRLVLFLLLSGKRRGEALHLRWSDVDLDKGLVTFRATKNGTIQTLPVNARCLEVLLEAQAMNQAGYRSSPGSLLVFPSSAGGYYHSFDATWQRFRKRHKLDGYRLHDLRHTYASYLASSGKVDIFTLKVLLGHKSLSMTARYAHLINGALQKAVDTAEEELLE